MSSPEPAKYAGAPEENWSRGRKAGDFHSRPRLPPAHGNQSFELEPFRWVVVRSTATPIVINLPDDTWP